MSKNNLKRAVSGILLLLIVGGNAWAQERELGDKSWTVESRMDRIFYFTHGAAVWGHMFGFFKNAGDCDVDTLWLTYTSPEEQVKNFEGVDVTILLDVDGKNFTIKTPMLGTTTIGYTQIMVFTDWRPNSQFMKSLMNGKRAILKIVRPRELEALMDFKFDIFGLTGFSSARKEAFGLCKTSALKPE